MCIDRDKENVRARNARVLLSNATAFIQMYINNNKLCGENCCVDFPRDNIEKSDTYSISCFYFRAIRIPQRNPTVVFVEVAKSTFKLLSFIPNVTRE